MPEYVLPEWAGEVKEIFTSNTANQFIITGNIHDYVPLASDGAVRFFPLKDFLVESLFAPIDIVLIYDRGKGIRLPKGQTHFFNFMKFFDGFNRTRFSSDSGASKDIGDVLDHPGMLPRSPAQALELIDRFIHHIAALYRHPAKTPPPSLAVIVDYAHFIAPRGESLHLGGDISANLIKLLSWAEDPAVMNARIINVLLTENLNDLNAFLVECPYNSKIRIPLPDQRELENYLTELVRDEAEFPTLSEVSVPVLSQKLVGLSRVNVRNLMLRALRNRQPLTHKYLTEIKKEIIEKEAAGRLTFIQSKRTLDDVAGHEEAKKWLRDDALLMKRNAARALPMGYLVAGRIGTGKTFLIECFSGECGLPFVALKNFREKWVGATEGNLEKIFAILHALGQVVVFVDEADQFAGRRGGGEGDSGLSGRIYGLLAKEMSNTDNRGKILWIFATSRPDLLEVDLKRQGRLDVHIPLFPPEDPESKRGLFYGMVKKLGLELAPEDLPDLPFDGPASGNELEGLLVRAIREYELQPEKTASLKDILAKAALEFRPSAHTLQLELMDLFAVKECTDARFLPPKYRNMDQEEVDLEIFKRLNRTSGPPL